MNACMQQELIQLMGLLMINSLHSEVNTLIWKVYLHHLIPIVVKIMQAFIPACHFNPHPLIHHHHHHWSYQSRGPQQVSQHNT